MSADLERRTLIQTAGMLAGAAAIATVAENPATAQGAQKAGSKMTYTAKPLSLDPKTIKGIVGEDIWSAITRTITPAR